MLDLFFYTNQLCGERAKLVEKEKNKSLEIKGFTLQGLLKLLVKNRVSKYKKEASVLLKGSHSTLVQEINLLL